MSEDKKNILELLRCYEYRFPALKECTPEQQDVLEIAYFLRDEQQMEAQLIKLDKILSEQWYSALKKKEDKAKQENIINVPIEKKLLSNYLYQWSVDNGFQSPMVFLRLLTDDQFSKIFSQPRLFKDTAFRGEFHGEWTHFIQWWCIVEANKDKPFLKTAPTELFKFFVIQNCWSQTFEGPNFARKEGNDQRDCRSVLMLNGWLISKEESDIEKWPVLHTLIERCIHKKLAKGPKYKHDIFNPIEIKSQFSLKP